MKNPGRVTVLATIFLLLACFHVWAAGTLVLQYATGARGKAMDAQAIPGAATTERYSSAIDLNIATDKYYHGVEIQVVYSDADASDNLGVSFYQVDGEDNLPTKDPTVSGVTYNPMYETELGYAGAVSGATKPFVFFGKQKIYVGVSSKNAGDTYTVTILYRPFNGYWN